MTLESRHAQAVIPSVRATWLRTFVQQKSSPNISGEDFTRNPATPIYGEGEGDVLRLMLVSVFDSV